MIKKSLNRFLTKFNIREILSW